MKSTGFAPEEHTLEEGVPLLPQAWKSETSDHGSSALGRMSKSVRDYGASKPVEVFGTSHNDKMLCYDQNNLLTVKALGHIGKSAFCQAPVINTLAYVVTLTALSAVTVFFIPRASKFDTSRFEGFATFLKFFIVFMLGIYVSQAFKRWWFTVTSFEKFLIAIRQMAFMLHTVKGQPAWREIVEKYCVASGYILNVEVRNAQIVDKKQHVDIESLMDWLVRKGFLTEDEVSQLGSDSGSVLCKTRAVWSWIGELVSHPVVEEGAVVLAPLLVRTVVLCQACITEVEHLKMNITMQTPFMYSQLLAILVHVNNIILSVCCGMSIGSSMNEVQRRSEQLSGVRDTNHRKVTVTEQMYGAIQESGSQLMIVLVTPMLYVAFLHIAHILCYPFGDESYHLPTETLIARLHSELQQMGENRMYFRKKFAKEWEELEQKKKEEALDEN